MRAMALVKGVLYGAAEFLAVDSYTNLVRWAKDRPQVVVLSADLTSSCEVDDFREAYPGRFLLGLGVSHEPMVAGLRKLDYSKPLTQMRAYLEAMDASPYMAIPPANSLHGPGNGRGPVPREHADGHHRRHEEQRLAVQRKSSSSMRAPFSAIA